MDKADRIIRIAGHPYTLKFMNDEWTKNTGFRGQCLSDELELLVASNLPDSRTLETIWHEIGHAVHHEYAVDFQGDEESRNSLYMSGLYQVMCDNPWLLEMQLEFGQ